MDSFNASAAPLDNRFHQPITMLLPDGTPFNVTLDDLNAFHFNGVQQATIEGVEIGTSVVMLLALLLLTQPNKRRSTIFILNVIALVLNMIRSSLLATYTCGPFQNIYSYFADDYSNVPRMAYSNSIATLVIKTLELLVIEASLTLQVNVVLVTTRRTHRLAIMALTTLVALIAVGFQFATMVVNAEAIMALATGPPQWIPSAANITSTISVCFFFVVFTAKLGYALRERRKLGLRQFGPMEIIFIMGMNTMIVPAIFSIVMYFTPVSELYTLFLSLVSVFLPLSSLWAASSLEGNSASNAAPDQNPNLKKKKHDALFANAKAFGDKIKGRFNSDDSLNKTNASCGSQGKTDTFTLSASGSTDVKTTVGTDDDSTTTSPEPKRTLTECGSLMADSGSQPCGQATHFGLRDRAALDGVSGDRT